MNVLVAAVGTADCPAARALLTEGVPCEIVVMHDDHDYGRALAVMWARRQEFAVIEHDIVPWPGAMEAVAGCEEPWCIYPYPFAPGRIDNALGFLRVSRDLVRGHPYLAERWAEVDWRNLDGAVYRALISASGERKPHWHGPPFAHVKPHGQLTEAAP